eukprot:2033179-Heterocapsa_arctica.AAC.1
MMRVQQSFDATTSLTLACKRLGHELVKSTNMSDQAQTMVTQGLALCRELVAPTEVIEAILTRNPASLSRDH